MLELFWYSQIFYCVIYAGMNYYGLYLRKNFDGSESESLTPIALNLQLNEGMETSFEPDTPVDIKVP